jgi:hypothetical protein
MKSEAVRLFELELRRRKVSFVLAADGRYEIATGGGVLHVNIENVARNYERDGDPEAVARFVARALDERKLPPWDAARSSVYWSAERFDHEFGETLREEVTETVTRVLVWTDPEEGALRWLTPRDQTQWGIPLAVLHEVAGRNLDRLLEGKRPKVERAGSFGLGMIPVDSALKASLIFAPAFRRFVESDVGWPVLAVIPCRDFIYVIAERDQELLGRMGHVVQREFRESGYPITTEVLRISDQGIAAIGKFPE